MKNNNQLQFSNQDLIALDHFLRSQTNDMSLVKAHGFITAIVSFPELFMPSEWIPILVGEIKLLNDQTPANIMLDKLITMYKQVAANLSSQDGFQFILSPHNPALTIDKAPYDNIREWCNGYCLALVWNEQEWLHAKELFITKACATFFLLTDLIKTHSMQENSPQWQRDKQALVKNLPELIKALYVYWLNEQRAQMRELQHSKHELCPCGSNRQYRNCCLLEAAEAVLH